MTAGVPSVGSAGTSVGQHPPQVSPVLVAVPVVDALAEEGCWLEDGLLDDSLLVWPLVDDSSVSGSFVES